MKKVNLNNLYESHYPPTDINTLWVDRDESTGNIRAIHKYNKAKGRWEPDMVSVDFMNPDDDLQGPNEIVYHSADIASWGSVYTLKDTANSYKHHCLVIQDWENLPTPGNEDVIESEPMKRGSHIVSIYDRDWSSSTAVGKGWADKRPVINGVTYKLIKGIFGYFAGNDGFEHKFHAISPAQYEQFKTGMTVSSSSSDRFDAILIIRKV